MNDKRSAFAANPTDPRHGTHNGYGNLGCRCDRCREANRIYHGQWMKDRQQGTSGRPCSVLECERNAISRGLCYLHYSRVLRSGEVTTQREREELERSKYDLGVPYGHPWWWRLYNIARGRTNRSVQIDLSDTSAPIFLALAQDAYRLRDAAK